MADFKINADAIAELADKFGLKADTTAVDDSCCGCDADPTGGITRNYQDGDFKAADHTGDKIDLYLLTGFLGSGKTTLLKHVLENAKNRKIGVIQNEFGKIGIDGEELRGEGIAMTEINRGSIFCHCLKSTFAEALGEMGKMDLDTIFVESSGLADPSNMGEIMDNVREKVGDVYDLKGVICLVDAVNFPEQVMDQETVERQLAHCHIAVVNKKDLVSEEELQHIIRMVRDYNPKCRIVSSEQGNVSMFFLSDDLKALQWKEDEESINCAENKPKTFSMELSVPVKKENFTKFLEGSESACFRIKGFVELDDGWNQVDVVEKLIDYKPCEPRNIGQLVFLSKTGNEAIRTVGNAWKANVPEPMKLKN